MSYSIGEASSASASAFLASLAALLFRFFPQCLHFGEEKLSEHSISWETIMASLKAAISALIAGALLAIISLILPLKSLASSSSD